MKYNAHSYNITIRKGTFEGEELFEARIKELPDVAEYSESQDEAYDLAIDTIVTTAEIFEEKGRSFPDPYVPVEDFSGRTTLRLPRTLHRSLTLSAEEENVSLNQYIVTSLSYNTGYAQSQKHAKQTLYIDLFKLLPVQTKSRPKPLRLVGKYPIFEYRAVGT